MQTISIIVALLVFQYISICSSCNCPSTCAKGCDSDCNCIGYNVYVEPEPAWQCVTGYWGNYCEHACASTCQVPGCTVDGNCIGYANLSNISPAYHCQPQYWGNYCEHECPTTCSTPECTVDGNCVGYSSYPSDSQAFQCQLPYWGNYCQHRCPTTCALPGCTIDGNCVGYDDYSEPYQAIHCQAPYYGDYCEHSCSTTCSLPGCTIDGNCVGYAAIEEPHQAIHCQTCYWGDYCEHECSTLCAQAGCTVDGNCVGYETANPCVAGYWGDYCEHTCPSKCPSLCDINGDCYETDKVPILNTRDPSIVCNGNSTCPPECSTCSSDYGCLICGNNHYGPECNVPCPENCLFGCNYQGECLGCKENTCGDTCSHNCTDGCTSCYQNCTCPTCESNYYGDNCIEVCTNCIGFNCDSNGNCVSGCVPGFSGNDCNTACTSTCSAGKFCMNGECMCTPGYYDTFYSGCAPRTIGMTCEDCQTWVGLVQQAAAISGKSFPTYEDALAVVQEISCFFLPPPDNIGCELAIITEGDSGYVLIAQYTEDLLHENSCTLFGACTSN